MTELETLNNLKKTIFTILKVNTQPISYLHYCEQLLHQTDNLYTLIDEHNGNMKYMQQMENDVFAYVEYERTSIQVIKHDFENVKNSQKKYIKLEKYIRN